jgi:hypothetical protein
MNYKRVGLGGFSRYARFSKYPRYAASVANAAAEDTQQQGGFNGDPCVSPRQARPPRGRARSTAFLFGWCFSHGSCRARPRVAVSSLACWSSTLSFSYLTLPVSSVPTSFCSCPRQPQQQSQCVGLTYPSESAPPWEVLRWPCRADSNCQLRSYPETDNPRTEDEIRVIPVW